VLRLQGSVRGIEASGAGFLRFLERHPEMKELLDLGPSVELVERPRVQGQAGVRLLFERYDQGRRVLGAELSLAFGPGPKPALIWMLSRWPARPPAKSSLDPDRAMMKLGVARLETALAKEGPTGLKVDAAASDHQLVVVDGDREHPGWHEAIRVLVRGARLSDGRPTLLELFLSNKSGEELRRRELLKFAGTPCLPCNPSTDPACGRLFFAGPVEALDDPSLRDQSNVDAALSDCQLPKLSSSSRLDGQFANTSITGGRISPPYDALRSQSENSVDELGAYFHATRAHAFLSSLGLPQVMNFSLPIAAHDPQVGQNAYYDPNATEMHFGTDTVDFAQDPDVIYHEYGHAVQDNMVRGWGQSLDTGSMGEGFGDYLAASITDDLAASALGNACLSSWITTAIDPYNGTLGSGCLRRMDNGHRWPQDLIWEVHEDGKIWSNALWKIRSALGAKVGVSVADTIVLESHTFLTPNAEFRDAADALIAADRALNGGANFSDIDQALFEAGLPRSGVAGNPSALNNSSPFACETPHNYLDDNYYECRITQPGAVALRLHFSRFNTEQGFDFAHISDGRFNEIQALDGAPFGSAGGNTMVVQGDTIVLRLRTDPGANAWGFKVDKVDWASVSCAIDAECDDGLFCTGVERCSPAGYCVQGAPPTSSDEVACTLERCDEGSKSILHEASDAACSDGIFCNGAERCDPVLDCQRGPLPVIDDGVACTQDTCVERRKVVEHLPQNSLCDDLLACNGVEWCDPSLGCQSSIPAALDDGVACTRDNCNPVTGAPIHTPDHSLCEDGLFCNGAERCDASLGCVAGSPPLVSDEIGCTTDLCDEATRAVTHTPEASACSDGIFCNGQEICDPALDCQPDPAFSLKDQLSCTIDSCDEASQTISHTPKEGCKEGDEAPFGCGCRSAEGDPSSLALFLLALGFGLRRRRFS